MSTLVKRLSPIAMLALAGAAPSVASADVTLTASFTNKASYKLAYNSGNTDLSIPFGANGTAHRLLISGTLHRNTAGSFPREACLRIRRLVHLSPNISIVTHEFVAQPFTGTTWDANGNATVTDALVLPVPESKNFNGGFSWCSLNEPGHFDVELFEQYDDNAADTGPTPDATWTNLSIKFDNTPPTLDTPAPVSGTVGTTTRYGVHSNDTLGHPGVFTGSFIDPLAKPANTDRIRHVRVTGYVTLNALTNATDNAGPNEAGQVRLRLQRYESVLLSPNDLQPYVNTDDLTITAPAATASTGYISLDIPIAADDEWGDLTRNVPMGGENASYGGIKYWATAYESDDNTSFDPDNIWNGLKIELFSKPQPAPAIDLGVLNANPIGTESTRIAPGVIPAGKPLWYRFELPGAVSNAAGTFLDIDTEQTVPGTFDTMIALYNGSGANVGDRRAFDDDDGSDHLSQLSFGQVGPRPGFGDSSLRNGRDGSLNQGVYYVAVVPFVSGTGTTAFGTTDFDVTNPDTVAHAVTLNLRYNLPLGCGPADIGGAGGLPGADGALDNNDFIVFIDYFFNQNPVADMGVQGGLAGSDGQFDNNDFIAFIDKFFLGC